MSSEPRRIKIGRLTLCRRAPEGNWTADFWDRGKHCRRSLKTKNIKVARERAIRLEGQLATGELASAPRKTDISAAVLLYVEFLKTEGRRPKTLKKYASFIECSAQFARDQKLHRLDQLHAEIIDRFRALRNVTHSRKSMHNEGVMLKGFLKWCALRGLVALNPMAGMAFKRPPLIPRGGPTLEQIDLILGAAFEPRRTQLAVLAFTGMRSGELQRLRCEDLDFEGNWLHIISREGKETKTGHSRKVPIHPRLRDLLLQIPRARQGWLFTAPPSKKYPYGSHWISTKLLNEYLLTLLERLNMPAGRQDGITVHSLRHSFKAIAINARIPERAVDIWLGHQTGNSVRAAYYLMSDEESQRFMNEVPFGAR